MKKRLAEDFKWVITFYLQPTVRHYLEFLYVNLFFEEEYFCENLNSILAEQETLKIQPLMSALYVASFYLLYKKFVVPQNFIEICKKVSLNIGNNSSFSRYLSQYILNRLIEESKCDESDAEIQVFVKIMKRNKENMVLTRLFEEVIGKYHYLITNLSILNLIKTRVQNERMEVVHGYICDQFKDLSIQSTISQIDDSIVPKPEEAVMEALNTMFNEMEKPKMIEEEDVVFQRKIDNVLSIFPVGETRVKRKSEIVVIASLLEKMPNLANLTRTCEIFGVRELVIPTKNILKDQGFLTVTVTAEKWLPFVECPPDNLAKLLMMYRADNYKVCLFYSDHRS